MIQETRCVHVVDAPSARSALSLIQSWTPDVIVLDLELQLGTEAFSLLASIGESRSAAVIVALTSNAIAPYEARCAELGVDHFFDKFRHIERVLEVLSVSHGNQCPRS